MSIEKDFRALDNKIQRLLKAREKTITKNYKATLESLRTTLRRIYDKYELRGQLTFDEMAKYSRMKKLDAEIAGLVKSLYSENKSLLTVSLRTIYNDSYKATLGIVEGVADRKIRGILKPIDVTRTINEEMAGIKWTDRLGRHRAEAIYNIQATVKQGLVEGSTYKQMSDRLKTAMEGDAIKPVRIVRTEGHRVMEKAKIDSLDKAHGQGVKMVKIWMSSIDERVRSQHRAMDGQTVPYEDDFIFPDGIRTQAPGLSGAAHHDINCRCTFRIDIK